MENRIELWSQGSIGICIFLGVMEGAGRERGTWKKMAIWDTCEPTDSGLRHQQHLEDISQKTISTLCLLRDSPPLYMHCNWSRCKSILFSKILVFALVRAADSQMLHQQHPGTFGRERPFTVSTAMTLQFDLTSVFYRVFFDRCWTLKDWRADGSRKNILAISCFVSSTWWKVMASKNSGKWNYSFPVPGAAGANNCNYWRGNLKQVKGKLDSSTDPENSKGR